jgi:hypothetical protein
VRPRRPAGEFQEWLVPRLFIPSGVLTLVFGVRLVFEGPWSFGDLWILVGLAGWIAAWGSDSYHQATGGTRDSPCNDLGTGVCPCHAGEIRRRLAESSFSRILAET